MNDLLAVNRVQKKFPVYEQSEAATAISPATSSPSIDRIFRFSDVTVDIGRRRITRCGKAVQLTRIEYNLLAFFLQNIDWPLERDTILNAVWGYDVYPTTRTVDVHIARLRSKLEGDPATPRHFLTIHGVGYRFLL